MFATVVSHVKIVNSLLSFLLFSTQCHNAAKCILQIQCKMSKKYTEMKLHRQKNNHPSALLYSFLSTLRNVQKPI